MLAVIEQAEQGYTARFERQLKHSVQSVWGALTDNDKLAKWFSELRIDDLRVGGAVKFDMGDGTFEELEITEMKPDSVLEYAWGEDQVRFELYPEEDGCRLLLIERISQITGHTPKDLAGWHVCLEVMNAVLEGRTVESREDDWKSWYAKYQELVGKIPGSEEQ
ncbi:SRPBCC family protein [Paenibacillus sp. CN-4]|uniref:SRPBCC family protein n=1 Tax=Paenibacillus nanchangensis TaxID=3348343 RepID=UPI00397E0351